jgi:hypothetical protein
MAMTTAVGRVLDLSLSFSVAYLPSQMGNMSTRKAKSRGVQGKGKIARLKRGETERFETPTTYIKCGHRNVSSRLGYVDNRAHAPYKSTLAPRTIRLA